uniref:Uncharacterized protein n=1 Tax=Meloidogyne enterolobii TaxID=390850 RepID=A0A6V7UTL4_MELEN|nr:unnamed protein product [Meloidogyne enterolobii]
MQQQQPLNPFPQAGNNPQPPSIRDLLNQKKEEFEQFSVNLGRLSVARLTAINKKTNITFHNCKSICEIILGYNMVFLPQFNQYDLVWPDLYYPGADNVNLRVRVARKFKILEGWCELGWNMLENIVMDQSDINEVRVILETVDRYTRSISNIMRGLDKTMSPQKQPYSNATDISTYCVISNEEVRRVHCHHFPNLKATTGKLADFLPNVCYFCIVAIKKMEENEDFKQICAERLKLKTIFGVKFDEESDDFIAGAPWEPRSVFVPVHPLYPKSALPWSDQNKVISSECVVINDKEVFVVHRPNHKGLIGFIIPGDFMYVDGRVLGCELYFCRYNMAYIVYGYYPHPLGKGGLRELAWCTPMTIGSENPMYTHWKDGGVKEFLGYVKLCRFNNFYCTFCIPLIVDPKNVLHGRVLLGDSNKMYQQEKEQNVGVRVWLKFNSDKKVFRWEITGLFDVFKTTTKQLPLWARPLPSELEGPKHHAFTSVGLRINRKGAVYCPHVCNFPMFIDSKTTNKSKISLGDWFSFNAIFDEKSKIYRILSVIKLVQHQKYLFKQIDGEEDVFMFNIPLTSNYFTSRHLLFNEEFGFVEDVDKKIIMFTIAFEETHPDTNERGVWCRENPDVENRLVPFCVVGIEDPAGVIF